MLEIFKSKKKKKNEIYSSGDKEKIKAHIKTEGENAAKKIKKKKKLTSKDYELCRQIRKARIRI